MKILVFDLTKGTSRTFSSVEEAARFYALSPKRVERQIITGGRWKGLTFDLLEEQERNPGAAVGRCRI